MLPIPAFAEYEQALRTVDCEIIYHELKRENNFSLTESFLEELTEDIDLVFLCSPSNPSGQVIEPELMKQILTRCEEKKIRLVLDECFIEFLEEAQKYTMVKKVTDHPSLFLVQAFTKMYGIPGLRLGYAMTSDARTCERADAADPSAVECVGSGAGSRDRSTDRERRTESSENTKQNRGRKNAHGKENA